MSCVNCGHGVDEHAPGSELTTTMCAVTDCDCDSYEIAPIAPLQLVDVITAIADAVLAEREACAEIVREHMKHDFDGGKIARAILARGEP